MHATHQMYHMLLIIYYILNMLQKMLYHMHKNLHVIWCMLVIYNEMHIAYDLLLSLIYYIDIVESIKLTVDRLPCEI